MQHETTPFWKNTSDLQTYPSLGGNVSCDVCIIGAGISGLTTGYLLAQSGKKVVIVDDGPVAGGQTFRTTGHLASALDDRYFKLERYFGKKGAKLAAESHQAAIDFIESLVYKQGIDCDYETLRAYLFEPSQTSGLRLLKKEFAAAKRAGLNVKMVSRAPLESFDTGPAICFSHQAHFHPIKYLNKLCELIEQSGGTIYCNTHIDAIDYHDHYFLLETAQHHPIHATHVVVATNSPIVSRYLPHLKQAAYRTYVIAGSVPEGYVAPGLYYDTLDPYHYVRTAKDKDGKCILIIGGEDHRTAEEGDFEGRYRRLEMWTRERFPQFGEVSYRWSGQILEPIDCLGFIGKVQKDQELYMITGDSGNGLTHGTLAGLLIHDLIHGVDSPWADLYDPHRKTLKAAPEFLAENLNTACQYKDWLTSGESTHLEKGSGAVVRRGLKKCALYRDHLGNVHEMSAVCPHLGALVRWNQSEHCWECPAHGSRFNAKGDVIQGPANCSLKKKLC